MSKTRILLPLILLLMTSMVAKAQWDTLDHDGRERYYLVHVPPSYDAQKKYPLIIAMHGGLGSALNIQNQAGLNPKTDAAGYLVVYPEGVKSPLGIRTWNGGACCGYARNNNIDDVGFIDAMLDSMMQKYSIDGDRVYATGISNGGYMSYRLACELSDRIAAIAPVAASMGVGPCKPKRPVPVIHFQSVKDSSIPHKGGVGDGLSDHYNPPIDSVLNVFASSSQCGSRNDTLVNNAQYLYIRWEQCSCKATIEYFLTQDGGHSWPGGKKVTGDPVSKFVSASDTMIRFFNEHSLKCEPLSIDEIEVFNFKLYPNPAQNQVSLEFPKRESHLIELYDYQGKLRYSAQSDQTTYQINLKSYAPGMYQLRIDDRYSRKLIVMP